MSKRNSSFQKGQYYAARYRGAGGDLVVGEIQSVRTSGHIVLINMLTGKTSTKKAEVLGRRNKRVSKSQAKKILSAFKSGGKEKARQVAIAAPEFHNGRNEPQQMELPSPKKKTLEKFAQLRIGLEDDLHSLQIHYIADHNKLLKKYNEAIEKMLKAAR